MKTILQKCQLLTNDIIDLSDYKKHEDNAPLKIVSDIAWANLIALLTKYTAEGDKSEILLALNVVVFYVSERFDKLSFNKEAASDFYINPFIQRRNIILPKI